MLSITPSKLSDYLTCSEKFRLRHIEKSGSFSSSPPLAFGMSMHSALQHMHKFEDAAHSTDVSQILEKYWNNGAYSCAEENETYFSKGVNALRNYDAALVGSQARTIGTEAYMSLIVKAHNQQIRLGCKADRLSVLPDGSLEIVDYKTNGSGMVPTQEFLLNDLSIFLYFVLARLTYRQHEKIRITILNVLTMAKTSIEYNSDQIAENKKALWQCLKKIAAGSFAPRPSEACAWCDQQDNCTAMTNVFDFDAI